MQLNVQLAEEWVSKLKLPLKASSCFRKFMYVNPTIEIAAIEPVCVSGPEVALKITLTSGISVNLPIPGVSIQDFGRNR